MISGAATTLSAAALQYYQTEPITVGSDGSLYVLDVAEGPDPQLPGNLRVLVFPPNANGNVAPSRIITGGLTELSQPTAGAFGLVDQNGRGALGIAVDATGRIYVGTYTGVASILGFAAGATGNVEPTTVLSGPLTNMIAYDVKIGSATVTAAAASGPPSVSGDFLAYAANRGWNYVATPAGTYYSSPPPSFVLTLYADPTTSANTAPFSVLEGPAGLPDATAGVHASDATFDTTDGYTATSVTSITNGFSFSSALAGGIKVVPPSLTQGQTFVPYPGITATVVNVGFVPGSSACPNPTTAIGATVSYTIGFLNETISYVPGCGITDMVTDNGTEFRLQSIGTYNLGTLSVRRESMAETVIKALSQTWKSVFTPWSPHR